MHLFLSSIASRTVIVSSPQSFFNDCSCEVSDTLLQFVEQLPSGEYNGYSFVNTKNSTNILGLQKKFLVYRDPG